METHEKGEPEFHYSRERRLTNAGPDALYAIAHHDGKRPSFFRSFVATRSLRFMLLALVMSLIAVAIYQFTGAVGSKGTLGAVSYELQATWFQGDAYVTVARRRRDPAAVLPAADVALGAGAETVRAVMAVGETEFRVKIPAADRPGTVRAIVSGAAGSLELATAVR